MLRRLVAGRVSLGVELDLRNSLYGHLQRLELSFFDGQQTGQLMSRATVDLQAVRFFLGYGLIFIAQSVLSILLAAVAMFLLQPLLAALSLAPVPFVVLIADRYGRRSRPAIQEAQQRIAELTAEAEENVSGVRVVKAFAQEERQLGRFEHSVERVFDQQMIATRIQAFYGPMISLLPNLGLAIILLVGGREVINGTLSLGAFTAFYAYLLLLISPMRTLGYMLSAAQRATASGARIFEILDREPRMTVPAGAPALPDGPGRVTLEDVSLTFDGQQPPRARRDRPRRAGRQHGRAGRRDGLGQDRARVTTAAALRRHGGIGPDRRRRCPLGRPRRASGTRSRSSTTIRSCSPPPSTRTSPTAAPNATREEVERAARAAQADGFIQRLPKGYETLVGERGLTLSGGQRQRVAIARAILAQPRILILDDATSSVDASTEQEIKLALREVMEGRTTFVIAHRLSTIALADEIVVLEDGRLADRGNHDELLESSDLYREIVEKGMPDRVFMTRKPLEAEVAGL